MNNKRRGIALVINNIEFKENKHTKREGAEFDSENLERVLGRLHFEVHLFTDQTRDEIENLLILASTKDHSDADCFMCVIMSHGTILADGGLGVIGVDGELINIEEGAKSFFSNKNCPTLKNKPRLFFVDACWGQGLMEVTSGINIDDITKASFNSRNSSNSSILTNSYSSVSASNPDISDFLFSFSTLPTYVSLRDRHKGNWFIQEFASALDKLGETRTLSDIMHKVRQKLMQKTTALWAQMSVDHWMLSRQVIFTSKEKKILCSSKSNTYLLGILEKECEDDDLTYEEEQVCIMNEFPLLLLLTQIGKSCKFASVASDSKSVDIWLLLGKKKETLFVLSGHSHHVTALHSFDALHNNSKVSVLASGCEDGSIRIWNVKSGECLQLILGHEKKVVAFESIGMSKLASRSLDGTIRVWDISFHFVLHESFIADTPIYSLRIPPTSDKDPGLFVIAYEKLIQVYNSKSGELKQQIQTDDLIGDLKFVGGHRIVIAQYDDKSKNSYILIYDVETGTCKTLPKENDAFIKSLHSFGNNNQKLVSVGYSDILKYFINIWDLNSASCTKRSISLGDIDFSLEGISRMEFLLSFFSFSNHELVGGLRNGTIMILNVDNCECEYLARKDDNLGELRQLLLLDNGNLVGLYTEKIRIWKVETGACIRTFGSERFSFPAYNLSIYGRNYLINLENPLVALEGARFACAMENNTICIWNSNGFECELIGHTDRITVLKCLGNSMLASGSEDKTIRIWQIRESFGECLATFTDHTGSIEALMLFGKNRLASAVLRENVRVWNLNIQQKSMILNTLQDGENANVFKSIGRDKLAVAFRNKVSVWNVVKNTFLSHLSFKQDKNEEETDEAVESKSKKSDTTIRMLRSHGDDTLIGVVGSSIIAWNVNKGERMYILKEHSNLITSLVVVSGSKEFITGSLDGTIRVWDVATGCLNYLEKSFEELNPASLNYSELSFQNVVLSFNLLNNDETKIAIYGIVDMQAEYIQLKQLGSTSYHAFSLQDQFEIHSVHCFFV